MAREKDPLAELAKILAKAENNPSAEEAEMAMERAVKLSERYGIDLAFARMHQASQVRARPIKEQIKIGDPLRQGNDHLMRLFTDIAQVNDLRCTISGETVRKEEGHWRYSDAQKWDLEDLMSEGYSEEEARAEIGEGEIYVSAWKTAGSIYCTVYGFEADIEVTKKVYAIAVSQMISQANRAIKRGEHGLVMVNAKRWRANFYIGFTDALTHRLRRAKQEAITEAGAEHGDSSTALVLADKTKEVDDFYREQNPHFYRADGGERKGKTWGGPKVSGRSHAARAAGARAADQVNLHEGGREVAGVKGAIGG